MFEGYQGIALKALETGDKRSVEKVFFVVIPAKAGIQILKLKQDFQKEYKNEY